MRIIRFIYTRLHTFIQLFITLTKLCHIKQDHPVHIICSKCSPSCWHFSILSATTQRAFRPMVDILSIWWWSRLIWHNFVTVADNWIKICTLVYIGTYIRCLKFGLKIPDCLGKNVRKSHGGGDFFDSHCRYCNDWPVTVLSEDNLRHGLWRTVCMRLCYCHC